MFPGMQMGNMQMGNMQMGNMQMGNMQMGNMQMMPMFPGMQMGGGMVSAPPTQQQGAVPAVDELSESKQILRPELGGGLSVSIVFRYGVTAVAFAGANCTYVILKNTSDHPIRRIKIGFPADLRKTPIEDVAMLAPGQELKIPAELVLTSQASKQMKIDIRSDQGTYTGTFTPETWDISYPINMTSSDFEGLRKRLSGFSETSKSFPLTSLGLSSISNISNIEVELIIRIKKIINAFVVQGAGVGEMMFASAYRKGMAEEKILITTVVDSENVTVRFNCDDALTCTSLVDVFKRSFVRTTL